MRAARSAPKFWPTYADAGGVDLFAYAVLANIRRALEAMAQETG
jgi:hypothetical protein